MPPGSAPTRLTESVEIERGLRAHRGPCLGLVLLPLPPGEGRTAASTIPFDDWGEGPVLRSVTVHSGTPPLLFDSNRSFLSLRGGGQNGRCLCTVHNPSPHLWKSMVDASVRPSPGGRGRRTCPSCAGLRPSRRGLPVSRDSVKLVRMPSGRGFS